MNSKRIGKINGKSYQVPMAVEEPSVIAACSAIAKIVSDKGSGFRCESTPPIMIAQISIVEITDFRDAFYKLKNAKFRTNLKKIPANQIHVSVLAHTDTFQIP